MNQKSEVAAFVGIDWADKEHAWCLYDCSTGTTQEGSFENSPEAIETWSCELQSRFEGRPVSIAIEQKRGGLIYCLTKYNHLVLYPIHPSSSANYRRSLRPSGSKSDSSDASTLCSYLRRHVDQLAPLCQDTPETRTLQFLVEDRRKYVYEKTRLVQSLTSRLKLYFPQLLAWFSSVDSPAALALLAKWPSLQKLQSQRPFRVRKVLGAHLCPDNVEALLEKIKQAIPSTHDTAVILSGELAVTLGVQVLVQLRAMIAEYDQRIKKLAVTHPDYDIMRSFPGAGPALAPRLIAAFGTDRNRFHSAADIQRYSGIAPVTISSGGTTITRWRYQCPKFVRQTFHEWALHSLQFSTWAREYYDRKRAQGKRHHTVVRALAFKWIRIAFRCWHDGVAYDENRYLRQLEKRRGKAPGPVEANVEIQWKTVGGFSKPAAKQA
jgi:transposase